MLLDPVTLDLAPRAPRGPRAPGRRPALRRPRCPPPSSRSSAGRRRRSARRCARWRAGRAPTSRPPRTASRAWRRPACTRSPPAEGVLNARRALRRRSVAEYGAGRPAPARLRPPGPRRGRRRRPRARRATTRCAASCPSSRRSAANAPFYEGATRASPRCGRRSATSFRARASRPRSPRGTSSRRPSRGRCARARCPSVAVVVGGSACTRARDARGARPRQPVDGSPDAAARRRGRARPRRLARGAPRRRRARCRARRRGGSRRTAGRPAATASTGALADLETGERTPAAASACTRCSTSWRRRPSGSAAPRELAAAPRARCEANGAARQRAGRRRRGVPGLAAWLADRFLAGNCRVRCAMPVRFPSPAATRRRACSST